MQLRKLEIPFYDIYYCKSSSCKYRVAPSNVVSNRKPNSGKRIVLNFSNMALINWGNGKTVRNTFYNVAIVQRHI